MGWYRRFCSFSSRNRKAIQGWLSRSSFSTNNIRYQLVSDFRRLCIALSVFSGVLISAYCLFLIGLKLVCSETVPYTKRSRILIVSWNGEKETGKHAFEGLEAEFRDKLLPLNHPDSIRIRGIAHNIIDALHRDLKTENHETKKCDIRHLWEGLEFIVFDGHIEPCRYFGRKIVVSRGFLDRLTSDAEIATIIGHEVAHVVGRHMAEKATKMILWSFPYLMDDSYLADIFRFFERLPFSRRLELEADYIGMMLMASAGYDPQVAPQVYEKLGEINDDNNSTALELISKYPHAKTRVQLLTRAEVMKEALCRYREAQQIRSESEEAK